MAEYKVETHGLKEVVNKLQYFPKKLKALQKTGMDASMLVLWENVPPYPPPPGTSTYRRTGTLGRSLGSSEGGGNAGGQPQIYQVKGLGSNTVEGRFGTKVSYAEYVIGENQAGHMGHWWKLSSILEKASEKIVAVWQEIVQTAVDWLNSRTGGK